MGAAASAAFLLAGCGLVGVRVEEGTGGPVRVGTQPTQGPPETEPAEPEGPSLDGLEPVSLNLGSMCPARVFLYLPEGWQTSTSGTSFYGQPSDAGLNSGGLTVYCTTGFSDDPESGVNSSRRYQFSEPGTELLAERRDPVGDGFYWSYQADLADGEVRYLNAPTTSLGAVVNYPIADVLYEVQVSFTLPADDAEAIDAAKTSLHYLEVEGHRIEPTDWAPDA